MFVSKQVNLFVCVCVCEMCVIVRWLRNLYFQSRDKTTVNYSQQKYAWDLYSKAQ